MYAFFVLFILQPPLFFFFFFNDTATTEIYTLSLHDALPISPDYVQPLTHQWSFNFEQQLGKDYRSEEHTSELQSHSDLVCRLLLEKKKKKQSDDSKMVSNKYNNEHDA